MFRKNDDVGLYNRRLLNLLQLKNVVTIKAEDSIANTRMTTKKNKGNSWTRNAKAPKSKLLKRTSVQTAGLEEVMITA